MLLKKWITIYYLSSVKSDDYMYYCSLLRGFHWLLRYPYLCIILPPRGQGGYTRRSNTMYIELRRKKCVQKVFVFFWGGGSHFYVTFYTPHAITTTWQSYFWYFCHCYQRSNNRVRCKQTHSRYRWDCETVCTFVCMCVCVCQSRSAEEASLEDDVNLSPWIHRRGRRRGETHQQRGWGCDEDKQY